MVCNWLTATQKKIGFLVSTATDWISINSVPVSPTPPPSTKITSAFRGASEIFNGLAKNQRNGVLNSKKYNKAQLIAKEYILLLAIL